MLLCDWTDTTVAAGSINFVNSQVASGSRWVVLQSLQEDKPNELKHSGLGNFNATNDMRVFECAKVFIEKEVKVTS